MNARLSLKPLAPNNRVAKVHPYCNIRDRNRAAPRRNDFSATCRIPPNHPDDDVCSSVLGMYIWRSGSGRRTCHQGENMKPALLVFCLMAAAAAQTNDTLIIKPQQPNILDSITFTVFIYEHCCCGAYHNELVTVGDTTITISYSYDREPCSLCMCFAPGQWHDFKTGPVTAGTYGIYQVEDYYCKPGDPCPASPVMPKRIGEVTVSGKTGTRQRVSAPVPVVSQTPRGSYTVDGRRAPAENLQKTTHIRVGQ